MFSKINMTTKFWLNFDADRESEERRRLQTGSPLDSASQFTTFQLE